MAARWRSSIHRVAEVCSRLPWQQFDAFGQQLLDLLNVSTLLDRNFRL
jgi:hypothetical protein